jgi:hypothetical protein
MYAQLRRGTVISASAVILLGIAGIQAGIAQAAVDTPAPSPVLMSTQTNLPDHTELATPLHASSALQPADGDDNGGNSTSGNSDHSGNNSSNSDHSGNNSNNGGNDSPDDSNNGGDSDGSGNTGVIVG